MNCVQRDEFVEVCDIDGALCDNLVAALLGKDGCSESSLVDDCPAS